MSTLFFRNAEAADCERISNFVNAAYRGESSKIGWTTEEALLAGQRTDSERLQETIREHDSWIMLCFEDDTEKKLLASVHLKKENSKTFYLGMLTVDPTLQGGGIGKSVMNECERIAKRFGCIEMRMTVIHLRHELIAYYERRGYAMTGAWEAFPESDPRFGLPKVRGLKLMEMKKKLIP